MKILIIEDELHTAERLKRLILQYDNTTGFYNVLTSVSEAIRWFRNNNQPDLIFQDIRLGDGSCFDIFKEANVSAPVIFTTAFSEYALKSFEVNSIDYLVKPYDFSDIQRVLDKFKKFTSHFSIPDLSELSEALLANRVIPKQRFLIRIGDKYKTIKSSEIALFESDSGVVFGLGYQSEKFPIDYSLQELEKVLDSNLFFRINRKTILHVECIMKIHNWFSGRLKLDINLPTNEDTIVSRDRVKRFKEWLNR